MSKASPEYAAAARAAIELLDHRLGFDLWMVTGADDGRLVVVAVVDESYGIEEGRALEPGWPCYRVVAGRAGRFLPHLEQVPLPPRAAGAAASLSYIGAPIMIAGQEPVGTLCGIASDVKPDDIRNELPFVEMMARLLGTVMAAEARLALESDRARRAEEESLIDSLTGLSNRRGWERLLDVEQERSKRYGNPASIIVVDLDHLKQINDARGHAAGDSLLVETALILRAASRDPDIVARIGGDEFALLAVDCDAAAAQNLLERLEKALARAAVAASFGVATLEPDGDLATTFRLADQAMLAHKRARRNF